MKHIKDLVKEIDKGKDLDTNLPFYRDILTGIYNEISLLHVTMEYYVLYETLQEKCGEDKAYLKETLKTLHEVIENVFSGAEALEESRLIELQEKVSLARKDVMNKMEILTMYTDKLQIYEHVANRMELRYEKDFSKTEIEPFVQQVLQYIFSGDSNVAINENIKDILAELPVRMARTKYFQLIENSMSVYKGSDKSAVERFVYMLETSAMLYKPENNEKYFAEIGEFVNELEQLSFGSMSEEEFRKLYNDLEDYGDKISEIADLYVDIQSVLNSLYSYLLSYEATVSADGSEIACREIICHIQQLFTNDQWKIVPDEISEKLVLTEGKQESLVEDMMKLQGVFSEITIGHKKELEDLALIEDFSKMEIVQQLVSTSSTFVDFDLHEEEEEANEEYIIAETQKLIEKLKDSFKNHEMCVNRAIIAATISRFPVFFTSSKEVEEYIRESLERCQDEEERQGSINIIQMIMKQ